MTRLVVAGKDGWFSTGSGRPFNMEHRTANPKKTTAELQVPVPLDVLGPDQPGKGPVNFMKAAGALIKTRTKLIE